VKQNGDDKSGQELVQTTLNGDLRAFETLVNKYQEVVFGFLFHFMGHRGDAEDVTQEAFLQLFRKLSMFDPAQSLKSWLLTMARNLAISYHRQNVPTPLDPEIIAGVIKDIVSGPEAELLLRESITEVQQALQKLQDEFREVLILRYLMDYPIQKVAEILNIPLGTVKSRVFHARNELRRTLMSSQAVQAHLVSNKSC